MPDEGYRYVVTVEHDCSIYPPKMSRVVVIDRLRPAKAIRKALKQIMLETGYDFWQSDRVTVKCERTA